MGSGHDMRASPVSSYVPGRFPHQDMMSMWPEDRGEPGKEEETVRLQLLMTDCNLCGAKGLRLPLSNNMLHPNQVWNLSHCNMGTLMKT